MQTPFSPEMNLIPYRDRASAGRWLAKLLEPLYSNAVVLAIPRGGVLVAAEIALALRAPLDVFLVRKIFVGAEKKRYIGSMASGGVCVLNQDVLHTSEAEAQEIAEAVSAKRDEIVDSERRYRQGRPPVSVQGRTVVLVDDGAATGASLRGAVAALRPQAPASVVVATPVASAEASAHLARESEHFMCPCVPDPFFSIGLAYERFPRLSEDEVCAKLDQLEETLYSGVHDKSGPYTDGGREG